MFDEINSQTNPIRAKHRERAREKKKEQWQPNHFSFSLFRFYLSNDGITQKEKKMAVTVRKTMTKRNPKW